jgi:hypothetical protein
MFWSRWVILASVAAAAALRLAASRGDLWMDEIWSVYLAEAAQSPLDVFTRIRQSNNHHLYTLWLYFIDGVRAEWVQRLPAVLAGTATVPLMAWIAGRMAGGGSVGRRAAAIAAVMSSASYLFTLYGSEARGYAPALFFGLAALAATMRGEPRALDRHAPLYWLAALMAVLSQLTSLYLLIGVGCWSTARMLRERRSWGGFAATAAWWHAPAAAAVGSFYFAVARHIDVGGAPPWNTLDVMTNLGNVTLGLPRYTPLAVAASILLLAALPGLIWGRSGMKDREVLFGMGIVGAPLLIAWAWPPPVLFERYFLGGVALWMLLVAWGLAELAERGMAGRAAALMLAAVFVAGQSGRQVTLLRDGRGQYSGAMQLVASVSRLPVVKISNPHPRNRLPVIYYGDRLGLADRRIEYVSGPAIPPTGPHWMILPSDDDEEIFPSHVQDSLGNPFRLLRVFGCGTAGLSGNYWAMYLNENTGLGPEP